MKKTIVALSALFIAAPVLAATAHTTDADVAAAHERANIAQEKLQKTQDQGDELKLKSEHAAEGKRDSMGSKISEGTQRTWHKTKEGTEKGWNATKEGVEKGWDKTKAGAKSLEKKVTD